MKHGNVLQLFLILFLRIYNGFAEVKNSTKISYDPAELLSRIFNPNITLEARQRGYGLVQFEDQPGTGFDAHQYDPAQYDSGSERDQRPLRFEDESYAPHYSYNNEQNPLKFEGSDYNQDIGLNRGQVTFQDDNKVDDEGNKRKRKRKRRRKPKNGVLPYPGANFSPGFQGPGVQGPVQGGYDPNYYPGYPNGPPYRPPRRPRPRPSLASEALSSVIEALTSIARYDDYQCVPRLLCEAAGGGGLSNNGVLQSIAAIQPLLSLLSAYNGISSSPLFVFGRAVFLGMTSKGNTGTCRYAYPQCPTDPEELIFYLNNYNGGFFRFFSVPQNLPPQNLEQFYNQLGQNQPGYPYDPNPVQGYYPPQNYPDPYDNQNPQYKPQYNQPSLYNNQDYGSNYAYDYNNYGSSNQIRFKDDARIEKRIQNRPNQNLIDDSFEIDDDRNAWHFPDDTSYSTNNDDHNIRGSRTMRFPDGTETYKAHNDYRKGRVVNFPEQQYYQNNNRYNNYNQPHVFTNNRYETTIYPYNRYETTTYPYNRYETTIYPYNRYETTTYPYNRYETTTYPYNRYETTTYPYNNAQNYQSYDNHNNQQNKEPNNQYADYQGIKYYNYNQNPNSNYQNNQNNYNRPTYSNYNNDNSNNNHYNNQKPYNDYQNKQNYYDRHQNMYSNNQKYSSTVFNNEEYVFDERHNFYVKKDNFNNNFKRAEPHDGLKTVYVVRGHGDPNKPEIVKLKPGQSVH